MRHANNLETVLTYEGTSEIHQLVIGQALTGDERVQLTGVGTATWPSTTPASAVTPSSTDVRRPAELSVRLEVGVAVEAGRRSRSRGNSGCRPA